MPMPIITATAPAPGTPSSLWSSSGISSEALPLIGFGGRILRQDPSTGASTPYALPGSLSFAKSASPGRHMYLRSGANIVGSANEAAVQNTINGFLSQGYTKTGPTTLTKDESGWRTILTIDPATGGYSVAQQLLQQAASSGGGSAASQPYVDPIIKTLQNIERGNISATPQAKAALAARIFGTDNPNVTTVAGFGQAAKIPQANVWAQDVLVTKADGSQVIRNIIGGQVMDTPVTKSTPLPTSTGSGFSDALYGPTASVNTMLGNVLGLPTATTTKTSAPAATGSGFSNALYGGSAQSFSAIAGAQYIITDSKTGAATKVTAQGGENYSPSTKVITSAPSTSSGSSGGGGSSKSSPSISSSPTYTVKTASGGTETRQNVGGGYKVVTSTPAPSKAPSKPSSDKKGKARRLFSEGFTASYLAAPRTSNPLSHFLKGKLPFKW